MLILPSANGVVGVDVSVVGDSDKGVAVVCMVDVVVKVDVTMMSSMAIASSALPPQNA